MRAVRWVILMLFPGICVFPAERPPEGAEIARAEQIVREVYRPQYASADPAQRTDFARELLRRGQSSAESAAARYVLLREAREIAASVPDVPVALRAVEQMSRQFGEDRLRLALAVLLRAADSARDSAGHAAVARGAIGTIEPAVLADDYLLATRFRDLAEAAAMKARNIALREQLQAKTAELADLHREFAALADARERLKGNGADSEAHTILGRHLCFTKGDWAAGLEALRRCSDVALRELAEAEQNIADAPGAFQVASRWWDMAQAGRGLARRHLRQHAAQLYQRSLAGVSGLNLDLAKTRIEAWELESLAAQGYAPGLVAELFSGTEHAGGSKVRVDPQIDFDWGEGAPDPDLGRDHFSIRWRGMLRIETAGTYQFTLIANTGVRLWIDGALLLEDDKMSLKRNGVSRSQKLEAGLHELRVEYWDTGGLAKMKLHWQPPKVGTSEVVPARAFWHDTAAFSPGHTQ